MAEFGIGLDFVAQFAAVHDGHHDVTDHEVDALRFHQLKGHLSVDGEEYVVLFGEFPGEVQAEFLVVFDDQEGGATTVELLEVLSVFRRIGGRRRSRCLFGKAHGKLNDEGVHVCPLRIQVQASAMGFRQGA